MQEKISVIIPVYNVEKYISKCLDSIVNQTYKNIEIILVNDGSIDKSGLICDEYAKGYNNIKVFHKDNGGVSSARNLGIDNASGEYLAFVDPDDYIDKKMYEKLYNSMKQDNSEIAISSFSYIKNGKEEPQDISNTKRIYNKGEAIESYFNNTYPFNYSFLCNKLFKKDLFDGVKLNKKILVQEDTEVMIKLYSKSKRISYIGQPLYFYELRNESATSNQISRGKITTEQAFLEIYNYTKENLSQFNSQALLKYISYFFNIVIEIIKNYDEYEDDYYILIDKLRLTYKEIINDKHIPLKYKLHSSLLLFSPKLYKFYMQKNLKIKEKNKYNRDRKEI